MASKLSVTWTTGSTAVYFLLFDENSGQVWSVAGSAFEAYVTANYANYKILATELGTASGIYEASMPAVVQGVYSAMARLQAGGSPSETADLVIGTDEQFGWTGTFFAEQSQLVDTVVHGGTTAKIRLGTSDNTIPFYITSNVTGVPGMRILSQVGASFSGMDFGFATAGSGIGFSTYGVAGTDSYANFYMAYAAADGGNSLWGFGSDSTQSTDWEFGLGNGNDGGSGIARGSFSLYNYNGVDYDRGNIEAGNLNLDATGLGVSAITVTADGADAVVLRSTLGHGLALLGAGLSALTGYRARGFYTNGAVLEGSNYGASGGFDGVPGLTVLGGPGIGGSGRGASAVYVEGGTASASDGGVGIQIVGGLGGLGQDQGTAAITFDDGTGFYTGSIASFIDTAGISFFSDNGTGNTATVHIAFADGSQAIGLAMLSDTSAAYSLVNFASVASTGGIAAQFLASDATGDNDWEVYIGSGDSNPAIQTGCVVLQRFVNPNVLGGNIVGGTLNLNATGLAAPAVTLLGAAGLPGFDSTGGANSGPGAIIRGATGSSGGDALQLIGGAATSKGSGGDALYLQGGDGFGVNNAGAGRGLYSVGGLNDIGGGVGKSVFFDSKVIAIDANNDIRGVKLQAAGVDLVTIASGVKGTWNMRQSLNTLLSVVAGFASGGGTASETYYDAADGTTVRMVGGNTAGADGEFNRTSATYTIVA